MVATLLLAVPAVACDKDAKLTAGKGTTVAKAGGCCSKGKVTKVVDRVMNAMPKMIYKVGNFETCCPDAAQARTNTSQ